MCYRVYQHTLVHDARPTVQWCSDEMKYIFIVNPYADPKPCRCDGQETSIATWLRCSFGHKCCYLVSWVVCCTSMMASGDHNSKKPRSNLDKVGLQHCRDLTPFHAYTPAHSVYNKQDGLDNVYGSEHDEGWYPWPVLDGQIGYSANQHELFPPREETIEMMSRAILKCEERIKRIDTKLQHLRTKSENSNLNLEGACSQKQSPMPTAKDCLQKLKEIDVEIMKVETSLAIKRMLFDAVVVGFTGKRGLHTISEDTLGSGFDRPMGWIV